MTLDLGNIVQTTDGESVELSPKSPSDTLSDTRFTHTWRTAQTDNFSLDASTQLADSEEFENTVLHVF